VRRAALAAAVVVTAATAALIMSVDTQAEPASADPLGEMTGGSTTVWATGRNAFSFPAANLPDDERTRFVIGNSFFKRNWVETPASTTATRRARSGTFWARSWRGLPHARRTW